MTKKETQDIIGIYNDALKEEQKLKRTFPNDYFAQAWIGKFSSDGTVGYKRGFLAGIKSVFDKLGIATEYDVGWEAEV